MLPSRSRAIIIWRSSLPSHVSRIRGGGNFGPIEHRVQVCQSAETAPEIDAAGFTGEGFESGAAAGERLERSVADALSIAEHDRAIDAGAGGAVADVDIPVVGDVNPMNEASDLADQRVGEDIDAAGGGVMKQVEAVEQAAAGA